MRSLLFFALFLLCFSTAFADEQAIEFGSSPVKSPVVVTIGQLLSAPAFREGEVAIHENARRQVVALAANTHSEKAASVAALKNTVESRAFRRIADVKLNLVGLPDFLGLCLAGHPTDALVIEACATTIIFVSSLTVGAKYLFPISKSGKNEWSMGPSISGGTFETICFDNCEFGKRADARFAIEFVHWFKPHFGFVWSLDIGGGVLWFDERTQDSVRFIPSMKNSIGVAF